MLTIPIERIALILDRASDVEPADVIASEIATDFGRGDDEESDQPLGDARARRRLVETLERLTSKEIYELLALAELADFDGPAASWDAAFQRALDMAAPDALSRLVHVLVLSDAIEVGLNRLGYGSDDDEAAGEAADRENAPEDDQGF